MDPIEMVEDAVNELKADRELGRALRQAMTPHKAIIAAYGIDEIRAVQVLLTAHQRLTHPLLAERLVAFGRLANFCGVSMSDLQALGATGDPVTAALARGLATSQEDLKSRLSPAGLAEYEAAKGRMTQEVDAFAADPEHPFFYEVADKVIAYLSAGAELKDAYERAIWESPAVRAKEIARLKALATAGND
jgi:hypothetical protein